jgi:hypothetical protein
MTQLKAVYPGRVPGKRLRKAGLLWVWREIEKMHEGWKMEYVALPPLYRDNGIVVCWNKSQSGRGTAYAKAPAVKITKYTSTTLMTDIAQRA